MEINPEPSSTQLRITKATCYHEAGHAAVAWWFDSEFHDTQLFINPNRRVGIVGGFRSSMSDECLLGLLPQCAERDLPALIRVIETVMLRILGGPVAELRFWGTDPKRIFRAGVIRFSDEYRDPGSDSSRLRNFLRALTGKDDKPHQLRLQQECNAIISEPRTWGAISLIAEHLLRCHSMSGADAEEAFRSTDSPQFFSSTNVCASEMSSTA